MSNEEEPTTAETPAASEPAAVEPAAAEDAKPASSEEKKDEADPSKPSVERFAWVPHTDMPKMEKPNVVEYCSECGMPPDYCEWGGKWDICKPLVLVNHPEFYPELAGLSLEDVQKKADEKKAQADAKDKVKELPGGKKKKSTPQQVYISTAKRQGRKMTTTVVGLDGFGVKLDAAAKIFKKKFACGSAAISSPGVPDVVEIQGDPGEDDMLKVFKKEFKEVPLDKIVFK